MKSPKAAAFAFFLFVAASVSAPVFAQMQMQRITGAALGNLLYGRTLTVYFKDGVGTRVRYDANGVMYDGSKRTGVTVRATKYSWCDFTGSKLDRCLTIWKDGPLYLAKDHSGQNVFGFTVR
ncbi:MAG TPA: hypothetical protein VN109_06115 [Devosia sp.]|jgi:hypothetical protein|nr:hypothetical protein [Devosia sp.]